MSLDGVRSLQLALKALDKKLRNVRGAQVWAKGVRNDTRSAVDEYFTGVKPNLEYPATAEPDVVALDLGMQALLDCSRRNTTKVRFRQCVANVLDPLSRIEMVCLVNASGRKGGLRSYPVDGKILHTLAVLVSGAAQSYEQAIRDLSGEDRLSWRGPATDLREALRETLDQLAPDKDMTAQTGFKLEKDCTGPTMKQKVRFVLGKRGQSKGASDPAEQATVAVDAAVGGFVRSVYSRSSVSTHTATSKDEVLRIRDLVRVVLCELLEVRQ